MEAFSSDTSKTLQVLCQKSIYNNRDLYMTSARNLKVTANDQEKANLPGVSGHLLAQIRPPLLFKFLAQECLPEPAGQRNNGRARDWILLFALQS